MKFDLSHFLIALVSTLVTLALVAALVWFGGQRVFAHLIDAETALRAQPSILAQLKAVQDQAKADSNAATKTCDARVASAMKSAGTIRALAAPRQPTQPGQQPALTADDLNKLVTQ